jgi:hypothetical protein
MHGQQNIKKSEDYIRFDEPHPYPVSGGARSGVVVKALRYKPAGRGFDFPCCHWIFSVI